MAVLCKDAVLPFSGDLEKKSGGRLSLRGKRDIIQTEACVTYGKGLVHDRTNHKAPRKGNGGWQSGGRRKNGEFDDEIIFG